MSSHCSECSGLKCGSKRVKWNHIILTVSSKIMHGTVFNSFHILITHLDLLNLLALSLQVRHVNLESPVSSSFWSVVRLPYNHPKSTCVELEDPWSTVEMLSYMKVYLSDLIIAVQQEQEQPVWGMAVKEATVSFPGHVLTAPSRESP